MGRVSAKYPWFFPVVFFLAGFMIDLASLKRIDQLRTLISQGLYLFCLAGLLSMEMGDGLGRLRIPKRWMGAWSKREWLIHFLFGSLLSAYAIFYFKSASFFVSFWFMTVLAVLLIANESRAFRKLGLRVKFGLYSLCLVSYFAYLVPILTGYIGAWPFTLALLVSAGVFILVSGVSWIWVRGALARRALVREVLIPGLAVQVAVLGLYLMNVLPPVPLSMQYLGVFHGVERGDGEYRLLHMNPAWKFWEKADQTFLARAEDRVFVFARIFSPTGFKEQIQIRWLYYDAVAGWQSSDAIPLEIAGGRDAGYRGFAFKRNFMPGEWRVQVETSDGREIGRVYFTVIPDLGVEPREFRVEVQ